ncbi:phosphoadenylyl-sulfate reductase [Brevibacillus dissolubilis]|uniref:phosphoadenylyl-sulfate reductase n=1 Tax=Brevibacillus dissolubilis TaxID=1844116 RepID=UPI001116AB4B|nr:phosphoadenylyl-sulfate reductase [Brevibacillus dissolubilis]
MTDKKRWSDEELQLWAYRLEGQSPEEIIAWAVEQYGTDIVFASSFGAEDVVVIDMIAKVAPQTPVFYLDTNKHFPETYETIERVAKHYNRDFIKVLPKLTLEEQAEQFGDELWKTAPNQCCNIRKVEPLTDILSQYSSWITGIRRDQAPTRANAKKIEWDEKFGLMKFNPLAGWTSEDVWAYIKANNVPYNPLHDNHYPSIGCDVCTRQVMPGEDPRAGRWSGHEKTECGLHK